jgi:uncharacterized protein YecT (DUF1311 family)
VKLVLAAFAAALVAVPAAAENWGDATGMARLDPAFPRSQAICRSLRHVSPPATDRPDRATAASLKGCNAEALFYGIGRPADPIRARQCAFVQRGSSQGPPNLSGDTMLMIIYANGVGATRNFDVAISLACQLDGAPSEENGRVLHLAKLKAEHWTGTDFGFCDDATSGFSAGVCEAHDAAIADAKRKQAFASVTAGWNDIDKRAFAALQKAEKAFVGAHEAEVDASGTARGAMAIEAKQTQQDDFLSMLRALAEGKAPVSTAAQLEAADAKLNATYKKVQQTPDPSRWGTVTKDGIRSTQRAWLRYRDAWVAFAGVKYPSVSADSIRAWLTEKRTEMLQAFLA